MIEIKNYRSCTRYLTKFFMVILFLMKEKEKRKREKKGKEGRKQIKYPKIETLVPAEL